MRLHVAKINIDAIIAQVSALCNHKDVLIDALGREQYDAQIVHLLGQLHGLPKSNQVGEVRMLVIVEEEFFHCF
jgi:hypothetical protein